jgi:hypothetical protein
MGLIQIFIFSFFISAESDFLDELRLIYRKQDEKGIERMMPKLEAKKRTSHEDCYYGSFLCLKAKFATNPYYKYKYFNQGYTILNQVIERNPKNPEFRLHRYMIEKNAPSFLIKTNHMKEDAAIIRKNMNPNDPLYPVIKKHLDS